MNALRINVYVSRGEEEMKSGEARIRLPRFRDEWQDLWNVLAFEMTNAAMELATATDTDTAMLVELFPEEVVGFTMLPNAHDYMIGKGKYDKMLEWSACEEVKQHG